MDNPLERDADADIRFARVAENESMLVEEADKLYVRFDRLCLSNAEGPNGLKVQFEWRGRTSITVFVRDARLSSSETLVLAGIEGRTEVQRRSN